MRRALALCVCVLLFAAVSAAAGDATAEKRPSGEPVAVQSAEPHPAGGPAAEATPADAKPADPKSGAEPPDAKKLSGMSIVGNDEAPKSLYIVPWKSSEIGAETSLDTMLSESDVPVDRDVFKRQLDFYKVSTRK